MSETGLRMIGNNNGTAKGVSVDKDGKLTIRGSRVIEKTPRYAQGVENIPFEQGYANGTVATFTKETDHLLLEAEGATGAGESAFTSTNKVDLTNVFAIEFDYEKPSYAHDTSGVFFIVGAQKTFARNERAKFRYLSGVSGRTTVTLDVSDLVGDYYLRVHAYDGSSAPYRSVVKVYNIHFHEYTKMMDTPLLIDNDTNLPYIPIKNIASNATETKEYRWLSTDARPTDGVALLAIGIEMDTGNVYYWNGSEWGVFG